MTTLIRRADGRFEIRESVVGPRGPRSRTLAAGRELTEGVLAHAAARATRPFDRARVLERARRVGIPVVADEASGLARRLLAKLSAGARVSPVSARLLQDALGDAEAEIPDTIPPMVEWIDVPLERRGTVLRELLRTTDRVVRSRPEPPRRGPLTYPRINSAA